MSAATYKTAAEAEASRTAQLALLASLNAWDRALRRDECGAWRISGSSGCVYDCPSGAWSVFVACRSAQHWTWTKKRLAFCRVTQDGDDEGVLRLAALPSKAQAAAIRKALGIRKRLEHSPEALERMSQTAFKPAGNGGCSAPHAQAAPPPRVVRPWALTDGKTA